MKPAGASAVRVLIDLLRSGEDMQQPKHRETVLRAFEVPGEVRSIDFVSVSELDPGGVCAVVTNVEGAAYMVWNTASLPQQTGWVRIGMPVRPLRETLGEVAQCRRKSIIGRMAEWALKGMGKTK